VTILNHAKLGCVDRGKSLFIPGLSRCAIYPQKNAV